MVDDPPYACAILVVGPGCILLERRCGADRFASNLLTCFGGHREAGESALGCLRRELREELGLPPPILQPVVELQVEGCPTARFFVGRIGWPTPWRTPRGRRAMVLRVDRLPGAPLSPWHRPVLEAWLSRRHTVEVIRRIHADGGYRWIEPGTG